MSGIRDSLCVCVSMHALKEIDSSYQHQTYTGVQCKTVAGHALSLDSKGQKFKITGLQNALPAWICRSIGLRGYHD